MIVGSVCSGIGCEAVAWAPLGWRHAFLSEIEPFPRAVLKHRFPTVLLHGDFTTIEARQHEPIDLLVGGTPCQSFSVAGLRGGLSDDRGNLALEFCRLARRLGPRWLVWENVPGVLSIDGGRAFGAILGGLAELGYGLAWRILDAQFVRVDGFPRAVPQRRRRLFVVGYLGDWTRAAAVLFERASLSGDSAPGREAREGVAHSITSCAGNGSRPAGGTGNLTAFGGNNTAGEIEVATAVRAKGGTGHGDFESETFIAHALTSEGFDAGEDGTGRGVPLVPMVADPLSANEGTTYSHEGANNFRLHNVVPVAFDTTQVTSPDNRSQPKPGDPCHPLAAGAHPPAVAFNLAPGAGERKDELFVTDGAATKTLDRMGGDPGMHQGGTAIVTAFDLRGREGGIAPEGSHDTANIRASSGGSSRSYLAAPMMVRRLTPRECERLQGLPDDWTLIPWRNGMASDGPRYRAIGNGMACNVMRWIGRRIEMVETVAASGLKRLEAAE